MFYIEDVPSDEHPWIVCDNKEEFKMLFNFYKTNFFNYMDYISSSKFNSEGTIKVRAMVIPSCEDNDSILNFIKSISNFKVVEQSRNTLLPYFIKNVEEICATNVIGIFMSEGPPQ